MAACAQIIAAFSEDIEGTERDLIVMLTGVEGIEIGDAINPEDDGLAVQHKPLLADFAGCLHDPWISVGPIIAASGDRADAITIPFQQEAVAIVFHFAEPVRAGLRFGNSRYRTYDSR